MKHRLNTDKNDLAFTLVELLVVTTTVGILAALLLPALSQAKKRAQQIQCVSNLHQLGIGLQVILSNDHGYPVFIENKYSSWIAPLEIEGLGVNHHEEQMASLIQLHIFMKRGFGFALPRIIPHILCPNRCWVLTPTMRLEFIRKQFSPTRLVWVDTSIQFQKCLLRFESQKWLVRAT
jgi:hypothetical protein